MKAFLILILTFLPFLHASSNTTTTEEVTTTTTTAVAFSGTGSCYADQMTIEPHCSSGQVIDLGKSYDQTTVTDTGLAAAACCMDTPACTTGFPTPYSCPAAYGDNAVVDPDAHCAMYICLPSDADACCNASPTVAPSMSPSAEPHSESEISSSEAATSLVVTIVFMIILCACGLTFFACVRRPKEAQGWLVDNPFADSKKKKLNSDSESESSSS